jgi:hypothetical protein
VEAEMVNKRVLELSAEATKSKADLAAKETELRGIKTALQTLQTQAEAQKKTAAEKLVNDAIAAGKLNATQKENWLKLALSDEALAKSTLDAIPAKKTLGAGIENPPAGGGEMTADEFGKLSTEAQLKFKNETPELYNLFIEGLNKTSVRSIQA